MLCSLWTRMRLGVFFSSSLKSYSIQSVHSAHSLFTWKFKQEALFKLLTLTSPTQNKGTPLEQEQRRNRGQMTRVIETCTQMQGASGHNGERRRETKVR